MGCSRILDMVYESEESPSMFTQAQIWLHTLICPSCAQEIERYEVSRNILREDFFPPSPGFEDSIMALIACEEEQPEMEETFVSPGGISTKGWIIAGLIILVSLATVFFGLDFKNLVSETGMSFLLPIGITVGIVVTTYGAFFIGSHLKDFSERFGL